ncbi:MAG: hypothetical protein HWE25_11570 [Alphaproteobacteria bacterium]|nr:hypothetical protein [Alphaproteobacteria bacterium]
MPQYLAFSVGILAEPFFTLVGANHAPAEASTIVSRLLFAMVIGLLLLPNVYKAIFNPAKAVGLQMLILCLLGLGWQSLFKVVGTAAIGS